MKVVMGAINGVTLDDLHRECLEQGCTGIRAAVAYAFGKPPLFVAEHCPVPVEFFGRFDGVAPDLLDAMLSQPGRVTCHLVPERRRLHAKIIWWQGRGAYVGSANLTDQGWSENLESGVFYDDAELADGVGDELLRFFDHLKGGALVSPTPKLIAELRALHAERANAAEQASRKLLRIETAAAVEEIDGMRVPPSPTDLQRARDILREVREGGSHRREWRGPYLAWAYYVRDEFGPKAKHADLAREAGETAGGPVSNRIQIMRALVGANPDIIIDWLRRAERCRRGGPGPKPPKPVPYGEMLSRVVRAQPADRRRVYGKLTGHGRRVNRGGRPSL